MAKRPLVSGGDSERHHKAPRTSAEEHVAIPSLAHITPWISSQISSELPPLPRILDDELEKEVFTHPGLDLPYNYERLEWLGDAYLELIASSLIHQTFTKFSVGRSSQLREQIIRNTTLAEYFRRYGLPSRAKLSREFDNVKELGRGKSKDKDLLKTQADMFEAYVAAVITSDPQNGLASVVTWLKALWGQTLKTQIIENESRVTPTGVEKEQLRQLIGAKGILLDYRDLPSAGKDRYLNLPLFSVGVYLTGWGEESKFLGMGTALGKQEAGHKAAAQAMGNKKLMKQYEAKKKAFKAAEQVAQESANASAT